MIPHWLYVSSSNSPDQFYTVQNIQRSLIPQTSKWSGTFFAVSYSKPDLVPTSHTSSYLVWNIVCTSNLQICKTSAVQYYNIKLSNIPMKSTVRMKLHYNLNKAKFNRHRTVRPGPIWKKVNTSTATASKYIPKKPRVCINWNPPFQTKIYLVKETLNVNVVK